MGSVGKGKGKGKGKKATKGFLQSFTPFNGQITHHFTCIRRGDCECKEYGLGEGEPGC